MLRIIVVGISSRLLKTVRITDQLGNHSVGAGIEEYFIRFSASKELEFCRDKVRPFLAVPLELASI